MAGKAAVDVARNAAAVEVDVVPGGCAVCGCVSQCAAVEAAGNCGPLEVNGVLGGVAGLGPNGCTIAVCDGAALQDELVRRCVAARVIAVAAGACLGVLGKAAVGCRGDCPARDFERVVFNGVADFRASAPCLGAAARTVGRLVVAEAVADDVNAFVGVDGVFVQDVFVVAVALCFPGAYGVVVREGDIVCAV